MQARRFVRESTAAAATERKARRILDYYAAVAERWGKQVRCM
jgi:hypothetical protein